MSADERIARQLVELAEHRIRVNCVHLGLVDTTKTTAGVVFVVPMGARAAHNRRRRIPCLATASSPPSRAVIAACILPGDAERCLLYLHQGNYRFCLLVNFGEKPLGIRRFVHTPALSRLSRRFALSWSKRS